MAVKFLLDENMEPKVEHRLDAFGHPVESIGDVPALGSGATDAEIVTYSRENERVILTYDDDFITDHDPSDYHCVIYFANESFLPRRSRTSHTRWLKHTRNRSSRAASSAAKSGFDRPSKRPAPRAGSRCGFVATDNRLTARLSCRRCACLSHTQSLFRFVDECDKRYPS